MMFEAITTNWWLLLLRGVCALVFGLLAFIWPGMTLYTLVLLYGAYALADGVFAIGAATTRRSGRSAWWLLLVGILAILAGIVTFFWPGITAIALLVVIATWAIIKGIFEIVAAIELRKVIAHEWLLALGGVISVLFGIVLFARPLAGALALVWIIGVYAIIFGISAIALSLRLRSHAGEDAYKPGLGGYST
jgi:uncharacterized membrane protein HdeD (DUF308 family)